MKLFHVFIRKLRSAAAPRTERATKIRLKIEALEHRVVPTASPFYSSDGSGNNLANASFGSAGIDLLRIGADAYGDGVSTPAGTNRPSARAVSNALSDQGSSDILSARSLSAMSYAWGQFVDHDLDLTTNGTTAFNVAVPKGDPYFDPTSTGTQSIYLNRSNFDAATGTSTANPRQQVNTITAWLDLSQVYGSDTATTDKLRSHVGGRMKMGADGFLPLNNAANFPTGTLTMANDAHQLPDDQLYAAGDKRANENPELLSLQTLFVREHNRIADGLAKAHPDWTDEQIFQQARSQNIAEYQAITYNEWLPAIVGQNAMKPYQGYNPNVNPGITNEFSTAAFRFGHSMLGDDVEFLDANGKSVGSSVTLSQSFFNSALLKANGIESVLKYLGSDVSQEIDTKVVNSVRNFLFGAPGQGGFDLASLNIQRGRDNGIEDYNSMRAAFGLPKVTSFAQITSDAVVQQKLKDLYGTVNNIDAWVGALAEDHVPGASVGQLTQRVLADQFMRLRDGDRLWYQNTAKGQQLLDLQHLSLSDVIGQNTKLTNVQHNMFFFNIGISGTVFADGNANGRRDPGEKGLANRQVQLIATADGSVVETATTDAQGNYHFASNGGLPLGSYQIVEVLPKGAKATTKAGPNFVLTRGDMVLMGVDLGESGSTVTNPNPPPPPPPGPPMPPPPPPAGTRPNSASGATATPGSPTAPTGSTDSSSTPGTPGTSPKPKDKPKPPPFGGDSFAMHCVDLNAGR